MNPKRVTNDCHDYVTGEIVRRAVIDYEEEKYRQAEDLAHSKSSEAANQSSSDTNSEVQSGDETDFSEAEKDRQVIRSKTHSGSVSKINSTGYFV